MKIENLTKEQIGLFSKYKDKWIEKALNGKDEFDVEKFKKGITFIYSLASLKDPLKIYVDSPFGLQCACQILKKLDLKVLKNSKKTDCQVRDQIYNQVINQVINQVRDQVSGQVINQVSNQ